MRSEDYLTIQGWMVNDLGLDKLNEAIIYALIYSFSRDGESQFRGSLNYIEKTTMISRPTVIKVLKKLEGKGLITKEAYQWKSIKGNVYYANLQVVKNFTAPVKNFTEGGKKFNPIYNINTNNNINNLPIEDFSHEVKTVFYKVEKFFEPHLRPQKEKQIYKWMDTIDKLIRIDKIPAQAIVKITEWARNDDFWVTNFLSLTKLRKKNSENIPYIVVFSEKMKNHKEIKSNKTALKNAQGW